MRKVLLVTLMLLASYSSADYKRGFFAGAAYAGVENDGMDVDASNEDEISFAAIELIAGYKYSGWLGLELRLANGFDDYNGSRVTGDGSIDPTGEMVYSVDSYQSIYYRAEMINQKAKLYGLLGYSSVEATIENVDNSDSLVSLAEISESGLSYGVGVGWFMEGSSTFNLEYRTLLDEEGQNFTVITAGFDYRF